jgi:uncharacterized membrane protein
MQTNRTKPNWLEIVVLVAPFLFLWAMWDKFPARVPIHWNVHGKIDGWSSKPSGLLLLPLTNLFLYTLFGVLLRVDPRIRRAPREYERTLAVVRIMRGALLVFMLGIFCVQVAAALGYAVAMDRWAFNGALILCIVMGNYLTNLRPNYFAGIRTPWTLDNPETWRATHRIGGRIMVFGGLLVMGTQFLVEKPMFVGLFVLFILGFAGWAFLYSWNYSRAHPAVE